MYSLRVLNSILPMDPSNPSCSRNPQFNSVQPNVELIPAHPTQPTNPVHPLESQTRTEGTQGY
ncbi:uncharacterized protein BDZ99DRAFT_465095 [Mytilinidion resinicola]|uniref:Uncharacterized protein n=1 Tax=Mytilinidion resinicola TaxID=574789 RepID=A0A6A6YF52_9PEZI|nr:uncharacterized protein BDZ99DRAFT_465095 [Mytilinidion resinicola]KAF2807163.1 hypothetical protein BDZ99DRAFT_465095 [Mytilinidion resinicola]